MSGGSVEDDLNTTRDLLRLIDEIKNDLSDTELTESIVKAFEDNTEVIKRK